MNLLASSELPASDQDEAGTLRKNSGVRRASPEEEVQRLYRQMSDGSLDLSPPSVPPLLGTEMEDDDEPITEQFELPSGESIRTSARDRGVLVRVDGPCNGQVYSLDSAQLIVGRSASADVRLTDEGVSRRHASLIHTRSHFFVEDMQSSNGTFLEGRRVRRAPLMEGDLLQFGPHASFRFCMMDTKQERAMMRLYEETTVDALTRVYNRRFLDKRLDEEIAFALRHNNELCVVLLDIDYFKHVNDRHGHTSGDVVLRKVADVVHEGLRAEDVLARYGGEEFVIVLRGIPLEGAVSVAERVRVAVSNTQIRVGRVTLRVTISAGCAALVCSNAKTKADLLGLVDERLYRAKRQGRNQVVSS